jgi:hypothetical protein
MPTKTKIGKVECREAFVGVIGARPPEYRTAIVRDRHTGQLAEVVPTSFRRSTATRAFPTSSGAASRSRATIPPRPSGRASSF